MPLLPKNFCDGANLGRMESGKGVEFSALIIYKFVRPITTLLLRIEDHGKHE
jgi:hypothetical protein